MRTLVALALSFVVCASAQADGIEAGLWRVTTKQGRDGLPQVAARCLTPPQAADPAATFSPQFGGVNTNCERVEYEASDIRVAWRLQCRGSVDIDVAAVFLFLDRRRYSATVITKTGLGDAPAMQTTSFIEGEHVSGECR